MEEIAHQVFHELIKAGIEEFCICPGGRNYPFAALLARSPSIRTYYGFEERSMAFFALGRARQLQKPVAIITTSGTAAAELLPATMEAYYTGQPLILVTADRPKRFRGSGAPQTAEQVGLFGVYTPFMQDIEQGKKSNLSNWDRKFPAHLNVCFEEPYPFQGEMLALPRPLANPISSLKPPLHDTLIHFLKKTEKPLVIVSTLDAQDRPAIQAFLEKLNAPVYLEGISGLREVPSLQQMRVYQPTLNNVDGVLRIGGVPTIRLWRDLEEKNGAIKVISISQLPFSGLSWNGVVHTDLTQFFQTIPNHPCYHGSDELPAQKEYQIQLENLFSIYPQAEQSLIHDLSKQIPAHAHVYLGNSLPIREWDLAATNEDKQFVMTASRGVNGIDGQISTFLGLCQENRANWAILGDMTTLYDMAGPWVMRQMSHANVTFIIVNNGGGKIFAPKFREKEMLNMHDLHFEHLAHFWGLKYQCIQEIPRELESEGRWLIEVLPDDVQTAAFRKAMKEIEVLCPI